VTTTPACGSAPLLGGGANAAGDKVVLADAGSTIAGFGDWAEQLIAESTGKEGKGLLPVVVEGADAPGSAATADEHHGRPSVGGDRPRVRHRVGPARRAVPAVGVRHRGRRPDARDQPVRPARRREREGRRPRLLDETAGAGRIPPASSTARSRSTRGNWLPAGTTDRDAAVRRLLAPLPEHGYLAVRPTWTGTATRLAAVLRAALAKRTGGR
jgi:glucose-6-phosphate isomerase